MKKKAPVIKKKVPGYADGTPAAGTTPDLSKLTPDQLIAYNKLTTPDAQSAYLQKLSTQTNNSAASLGAAGTMAAAGLVNGAVKVDPATGQNAVGKDMAVDALMDTGKGAALGAKIGSIAGPEAVLPAAAIGGAAGLVEGLMTGNARGKVEKQTDVTNTANQKAASAKAAADQRLANTDASGVISLKDGGEVDSHIAGMNQDHLISRIKEIGHEKAMKEYQDFFNEKKGRYSIKKKS